jgi:hypothetical protein
MYYNRRLYGWGCALLIMIMHLVIFLYLGENSYLRIDDNLDSCLPYSKSMMQEGQLFLFNVNAKIPQVMNGVLRNSFGSPFFIVSFFYVFSPWLGYVLNLFVVRLIGFLGMYFLLKKYVLKQEFFYLNITLSLLFFLLPFYSTLGISISGLPLLLYGFLNLLNRESIKISFFIIFLFSCYSLLVMIGPFVVFFLFILGWYDFYKKRKINYFYWGGVVFLGILYILLEYSLIYSFFIQEMQSQRLFYYVNEWNVFKMVRKFIQIFFLNNVQEPLLNTGIFLMLIVLGFSLYFFHYRRLPFKESMILLVIVCSALFCGLYGFFKMCLFYIAPEISFFQIYNLARISFLLPVLWFVLLGLVLKKTLEKYPQLGLFVYFMLFMQGMTILKSDKEFKNNFKQILGMQISAPNYQQFFSETLFSNIKSYIDIPQKDYRVVSVGIQPSVALFNGFYILDAFLPNYELSYREQFRVILNKELQKSDQIGETFQKAGNHCYIFAEEYLTALSHENYTKGMEINDLRLNFKPLKELGCDLIFSSMRIKNFENNRDVTFLKKFTDKNAFWDIFVYKIN